MKNFILDIIYPPVCGICGKISKENLCDKCENELNRYIINKHIKVQKDSKSYNETFFVYKYEGTIRDTIISYKFYNKSYLYKTFSKIIIKNEKACAFLKKYDIIIPVPIHKKRKKERYYNQSELISREIAKELNLDFKNNIIIKNLNITPQSKLNKEERMVNIKNAFEIQNSKIIENKNILLFDDIYTTGSTVEECAKTLKQGKCKSIGIFTIARD